MRSRNSINTERDLGKESSIDSIIEEKFEYDPLADLRRDEEINLVMDTSYRQVDVRTMSTGSELTAGFNRNTI